MDENQNPTQNPSSPSGLGPTPNPNITPVQEPSSPATLPIGAPPPTPSPTTPQSSERPISVTPPENPSVVSAVEPPSVVSAVEPPPPPPQSFESQEDEPSNQVGPEDVDKNSPVIATPPKKSKTGLIAGISAILLLVISVPLGIILVNQQQEIREKAAALDCKNIKAADGQSLDDPANIGAKPSFEGSYGATACQKWVHQHNLAIIENCEKAKCSIKATDGQSLDDDQNKGARPAFCEQAKYDPVQTCQLWVNQHNTEKTTGKTTNQLRDECVNKACTVKASDGQSLDDNANKGSKAGFCEQNGWDTAKACQAWVNQHNSAVGSGGGSTVSSSTPSSCANIKSLDGQTLDEQSDDVKNNLFKGANRCQDWVDKHNTEIKDILVYKAGTKINKPISSNQLEQGDSVEFCVKEPSSKLKWKLELIVNHKQNNPLSGTTKNSRGEYCVQTTIPLDATSVNVKGSWKEL